MQIDDVTLRWLVGGLIVVAASSIANTFKSGRLSARAEKALDDVDALNETVYGDNRKSPPISGLVNEVSQVKNVIEAVSKKVTGLQDGLDAHGSKEHKIAGAVRKGIATIAQEAIYESSNSNLQRADTGPHRAIGWTEQLPPPQPMPRRPALGLPREEPDSEPPTPHVPRPRRRGDI